MKISVQTVIDSPIDTVWDAYTDPDAIGRWNAASDDWHTTDATVDLREGGSFSSRMEAKYGSVGFDFAGTYTRVDPNERLEYVMADDRAVSVTFSKGTEGVGARVTFDAESAHAAEQQRQGWQAITNVHVYVPDVEAAFERAVAAGGTVVQPLQRKGDGDHRGGVADGNGAVWWLSCQDAIQS